MSKTARGLLFYAFDLSPNAPGVRVCVCVWLLLLFSRFLFLSLVAAASTASAAVCNDGRCCGCCSDFNLNYSMFSVVVRCMCCLHVVRVVTLLAFWRPTSTAAERVRPEEGNRNDWTGLANGVARSLATHSKSSIERRPYAHTPMNGFLSFKRMWNRFRTLTLHAKMQCGLNGISVGCGCYTAVRKSFSIRKFIFWMPHHEIFAAHTQHYDKISHPTDVFVFS